MKVSDFLRLSAGSARNSEWLHARTHTHTHTHTSHSPTDTRKEKKGKKEGRKRRRKKERTTPKGEKPDDLAIRACPAIRPGTIQSEMIRTCTIGRCKRLIKYTGGKKEVCTVGWANNALSTTAPLSSPGGKSQRKQETLQFALHTETYWAWSPPKTRTLKQSDPRTSGSSSCTRKPSTDPRSGLPPKP